MKALILNGLDIYHEMYKYLKSVIEDELKKKGYDSYWCNLTEKRIDYCTGCGYCSERKPGICVKRDDMQEIFPLMASSEFLIFVSPVSFGGYNSELKKAVDRYGAMALPTYTIHHQELHHPLRYPNPVAFMSIGILREENPDQQKTFELVSERMAICFFVSKTATVVLNEAQPDSIAMNKIREGLKDMEVIS